MLLPLMLLLLSVPLSSQDQKSISQDSKPETKAENACVIVKRMGPADEITSHLYSFGIRGKQFQYIEGTFPTGIKFHGRLTDNDVRKILDKGGKVRILEPKYTQDDLVSTRKSCSDKEEIPTGVATQSSKETSQPNEKAQHSSTTSTPADHPSEPSATSVSMEFATISVSSSPDGADIYTDGAFVGNAPATLKLTNGKHTIKLTMAGYKDWSREITAQAGSEAHLAANLEKSN